MVIYTVTSRGLCCPDALSILHFAKLSDTSMDKNLPPASICTSPFSPPAHNSAQSDNKTTLWLKLEATWTQETNKLLTMLLSQMQEIIMHLPHKTSRYYTIKLLYDKTVSHINHPTEHDNRNFSQKLPQTDVFGAILRFCSKDKDLEWLQ